MGYSLRLFGTIELNDPNGRPCSDILNQPKRAAVLAYLAAAQPFGYQRRDKLLAVFWPDSDQSAARRSLNQTVHFLRRSLGADCVLSRGPDEVGLAFTSIDSDTAVFHNALESGDWAAALALYRGELLDGFFVSDLSEFEQWIDTTRIAYRDQAVRAAWTLSRELHRCGDTDEAKRWAGWAASKMPYDESSFRRYLMFLAETGDRATAVRAYTEFASRLEDDLEIPPSQETARLAAAIRDGTAVPESNAESQGSAVGATVATRTSVEVGLPPQTEITQSDSQNESRDPAVAHNVRSRIGVRASKWRGIRWLPAIGAGPLASLGLGTVVVAYVALRALGIGPPATLLTRGILDSRDEILVAEFESTGGEPLLGHAMTEAMRIDLSQSRVVRLVNDDRIVSTLRLMSGDPATLDERTARDVAQRLGVKAVVRGDITPIGDAYLLTMSLISSTDGAILWADRAEATSEDVLIATIGDLSRSLRAEIGESLRDLRATPPLEEVTTTSVAALKSFSEGKRITTFHDQRDAIPYYERAIELDQTFAVAYMRIARILANTGGSLTKQVTMIDKAFRLRSNATEIERLWIESQYYALTGEADQALETWRALNGLQPEVHNWWNNVGNRVSANLPARFPDPDEGIPYLLRAFELCQCAFPLGNLTRALLMAGLVDSAQQVISLYSERFPEMGGTVWGLLKAARAYAVGDLALSLRELEAAGPRLRDVSAVFAVQGKVAESRSAFQRWVRLRGSDGAPETYLSALANHELLELAHGQPAAEAVAHMEEALQRFPLDSIEPLDRPYLSVAELFVRSGEVERAAGLLAEFESVVEPRWRRVNEWRHLQVRALVEQDQGGSASALPTLERSVRAAHAFLAPVPDFGFALEQAGATDSAIAVYERFIGPSPRYAAWRFDARWRAIVLRRLGALHEDRGDRERARDYYQQFVAQWAAADEVLQPEVEEARRRVRTLSERPGLNP